jgi:hypothetical protein
LTIIEVGIDNQYYSSLDGILYNKNKDLLIQCPARKQGEIIIPAGIIDGELFLKILKKIHFFSHLKV